MKTHLNIGIIGTGFMGKAHALAYRSALAAFPEIPVPVMHTIADVNAESAAKAAHQYGFQKSSDDWRTLIADKEIDVISITTPNILHKEMALAAIAFGKHVHCEKPLSPTLKEAEEMVAAAEAKGVITQAGFNYIKNPMLKVARDIIASGELGEITGFRGIHAEDYMHNPANPWSWRLDPLSGPGVIADLGSHIIGIARFLLGPITSVNAEVETIIKQRPKIKDSIEMIPVSVDDVARLLVRFAGGFGGTIEANWVKTGRKMQLAFEIEGSKGAIAFSQEHLNELKVYKAGSNLRDSGFTTIESGPQHEPYGRFCVAGGHQLGFNDLKTIEMAEFLAGIASGKSAGPDFREAYEIQKVVEAAIQSSKEKAARVSV